MSLNGFLVDMHTTSESNLEVQIDTSSLKWENYRLLIEELEDKLSEIDKEHSAKSKLVHERQLRAKYRRVQAEDRRKVLNFSPFPSKFTNILKNTRTYVYEQMISNCILLEHVGRRKVYMLPKDTAPALMAIVDEINTKTIDKLVENVAEFQKSDDYFSLKTLLVKHSLNAMVLDTFVPNIGHFSISVIPIDFSYDVTKDEFYEQMQQHEAVKGLEILKRKIEEKNREYATTATRETVRRIIDFTENVESGKRIYYARKKIEALIKICNSLKLNYAIEKLLNPLLLIMKEDNLEDRKRVTEEQFGTWELRKAVELRLLECMME